VMLFEVDVHRDAPRILMQRYCAARNRRGRVEDDLLWLCWWLVAPLVERMGKLAHRLLQLYPIFVLLRRGVSPWLS
jgi:hypothetical protein